MGLVHWFLGSLVHWWMVVEWRFAFWVRRRFLKEGYAVEEDFFGVLDRGDSDWFVWGKKHSWVFILQFTDERFLGEK